MHVEILLVNGCIQRIQQLSKRSVIIACDWSRLLNPW